MSPSPARPPLNLSTPLYLSLILLLPPSPPSLPPSSRLQSSPSGLGNWEAAEGGLRNAIDLVRLIREEHGDYFGVAVAGHPEGHVDARAATAGEGGGQAEQEALELKRLKEKVGDRQALVGACVR